MPIRILLAVAVASMSIAGPANASSNCTGPAGAGAVSQYCESVPNGSGGNDEPGTKSSSTGHALSSSTAKSLARAGADGAAVEALPANSAPSAQQPPSASTTSTNGSSSTGAASPTKASSAGNDSVTPPRDLPSNPLKAATSAVGSGPTAGGLLLWALIVMAVLAVAFAAFSRRNRGHPPTSPSA